MGNLDVRAETTSLVHVKGMWNKGADKMIIWTKSLVNLKTNIEIQQCLQYVAEIFFVSVS